jgi:hypothetical protein
MRMQLLRSQCFFGKKFAACFPALGGVIPQLVFTDSGSLKILEEICFRR